MSETTLTVFETPEQFMPVSRRAELPPTTLPLQVSPEIAAALVQAQQKARAVAHDRRNEYQKFNYASTEAIITEAKEILASCGLAVLLGTASLRVQGGGSLAFHEAARPAALVHTSGKLLPLGELTWPVLPDKGRPLDKAFAGALTSSLGYFLRDLLLLPRVDEADEMSARDDTPQKPAPPKAATQQTKAPPTPPPMPRDGRELMGLLAEWDAAAAQAGRCEHGDLVNAVKLWAAAAHGKDYEGNVTDWKVTPEFWESLSVKLRDFKASHPLPAK